MITRIQTHFRNYPYGELLKIGLPIILGQVGVIIVSFIDNMMVGQYNTDHFAAASFVNNLFALVYVLGIGFAYGLTPLVTTAWTLNRRTKAGALLRHSLTMNLMLAVLSLLVMLGVYFSIDRFGLPEQLLPIARPYFILQLISFFFFMAFNAFKQFFDGVGRTAFGMWTILVANLVNIGGNYLLIYGHAGMPEWGLFGAGVSTLVARILMLILAVSYLLYSREYTDSRRGFFALNWSWRNTLRLLKIGVPVGMYSAMETASFTIALLFVTQLGVLPLATHQVLCVVTTIGFFIYYGLGSATTILVSKYRTLQDMHKVREVAGVGLRLCIVAALIAMTIMVLSRNVIGYLFTTDESVIAMVSIALIPVILYQLGDAIQVLYANALRGMEDVVYLALYSGICHLLIEPVLAYTLGFQIGLEDSGLRLTAIWCAFPIGLLSLGLLLRHRFNKITS